MFYIITYATHDSGYFNILKKNPNITILGYGNKWNGLHDKIKGIIEFCKKINPNDIVCFVDGFDTIILSDKDEILDKYYNFYNGKIVFSKDITINNTLVKYKSDQFFGRCQDFRINSGMYIGNASQLINFWSEMKSYEKSDQQYATSKCKLSNNIEIDSKNILFYNYSKFDKINYNDKRIIVNNEMPTVIQAIAHENMNHVLSNIGYTDLPEIKFNYLYRLKTYYKGLLPEIIFIITCIILYLLISNKLHAIIICIILLFSFVHYNLYIDHLPVNIYRKIGALFIDILHISIEVLIIYLLFNLNCNYNKLIILNIVYLSVIFGLFLFRKCILTIINNKLLNLDYNTLWVSEISRIKYFIDNDSIYKANVGSGIDAWMNFNKYIVFLIILLNIYCLYKINYRK